MNQIITAIRTALTWEANGLLVVVYTAAEHWAALAATAAYVLLLWGPHARPLVHAQRPWLYGIGVLVMLAAFVSQSPMPVLLAVMASVGAGAVALDHFNPATLRWRVAGGLALYALASLAYLAYGAYLAGLDAVAWAEAIGGQDEAALALAQGRAFVNTLATWGLWLILPLGFLSLLTQGLLVHPPIAAAPEQIIAAVRTRGQAR
jgi:hypothetical protein